MKIDPEATKLNAINMLLEMACIDIQDKSTFEQLCTLGIDIGKYRDATEFIAANMPRFKVEDQLTLAKLSLINGVVSESIMKKYDGYLEEEEEWNDEL